MSGRKSDTMMMPSYLRVPRVKLSLFLALIAFTAFLGQVAVAKAASEPIVEVEPHEGSAYVGETFTINITIVNVQNLYALEVTLYWNASILQEKSINLRLGCESHPDGVLHELPNASIFIAENSTSQGEYSLAATSTAPAPTFNGSGNIVRITFSIISPGNCTLSLETQLYDYQILPIIQQPISNPIDHTTIGGFLEALVQKGNNEGFSQSTYFYAIVIVILTILAVLALLFMRKFLLKRGLTVDSWRFQTKFISRRRKRVSWTSWLCNEEENDNSHFLAYLFSDSDCIHSHTSSHARNSAICGTSNNQQVYRRF
jgi:hypothetical protein